jgi:hypothetical protein
MGVSGKHHTPAVLYPQGKDPPVPTVQEAGWAPELVWMQREEKSNPVIQSVVGHYTDWATAAPPTYK